MMMRYKSSGLEDWNIVFWRYGIGNPLEDYRDIVESFELFEELFNNGKLKLFQST
jgi:hypothetical protein